MPVEKGSDDNSSYEDLEMIGEGNGAFYEYVTGNLGLLLLQEGLLTGNKALEQAGISHIIEYVDAQVDRELGLR